IELAASVGEEFVLGIHNRRSAQQADARIDGARRARDELLNFAVLQAVARPAGDAAAFPRLVVVFESPQPAFSILPVAAAKFGDPFFIAGIKLRAAHPVAL